MEVKSIVETIVKKLKTDKKFAKNSRKTLKAQS